MKYGIKSKKSVIDYSDPLNPSNNQIPTMLSLGASGHLLQILSKHSKDIKFKRMGQTDDLKKIMINAIKA